MLEAVMVPIGKRVIFTIISSGGMCTVSTSYIKKQKGGEYDLKKNLNSKIRDKASAQMWSKIRL